MPDVTSVCASDMRTPVLQPWRYTIHRNTHKECCLVGGFVSLFLFVLKLLLCTARVQPGFPRGSVRSVHRNIVLEHTEIEVGAS